MVSLSSCYELPLGVRAYLVSALVFLAVLCKLAFDVGHVPEFRYHILYIEVALLFVLFGSASLGVNRYRFKISLLVGWLVLSSVATIASEHFFTSVWHQLEFIVLLLIVPYLAAFFRQHKLHLSMVSLAVLLGFTLTAVFELRLWLAVDVLAYDWLKFNAFSSYLHIRHLGDVSSLALCLSLFFLGGENKKCQLFGALIFFLSSCALMFTGGRLSIWVSYALVMFVVFLSKQRGKLIARVLVLVVVSFVVSGFLAQGNERIGPYRAFAIFKEFKPTDQGVGDQNIGANTVLKVQDSGRSAIWEQAWRHSEASFWFGEGPDTYIFIQPHIWGQTPHNTLLQFFLNWGVPAGVLAFVGLLYVLAMAIKWLLLVRCSWSLISFWSLGYIVFFFHGLVATTFYEPLNLFLVGVMAAVILNGFSEDRVLKVRRLLNRVVLVVALFGLAINLTAHRVFKIDSKIAKGKDIGLAEEWVYFNMPFTSDKFDRGIHRLVEKSPDRELFYIEWGERNTEYKSWYFTALKSNYYLKSNPRLASDLYQEALRKAWPENKGVIDLAAGVAH